jgi:hypothetical protein
MFALVFGGKFPLDLRRSSLWLGHGGNQHHQNQADKLAKDFEMGVGWHGSGGNYDQVGRLKTVTEANPPANVSLTYNALGALTSDISCGLLHSYYFDIVGNRKARIMLFISRIPHHAIRRPLAI